MLFLAVTEEAFQEFDLPNVDNTDYGVYLDKRIFKLKRSITLNFEVINRKWMIRAGRRYKVIHHKQETDIVEFSGNELITIKTTSGEIVKGFMFAVELSLIPFDKYSLKNCNEILIGSGEDCSIVYAFHRLVSKKHCSIRRNGNDYELLDHSANGSYLNCCRVRSPQQLCFGDVINVFDLRIIFLGEVIAIKSSCGEFKVASFFEPLSLPIENGPVSHVRHRERYFNRAPRMFPSIASEEVVIEPPTALNNTRKKSLLLTVGPSFTMAIPMLLGVGIMILSSRLSGSGTSPFMYMGLITAVGSAVLGSMWALLNIRESNRREIEEESQRFNLYSNYLIDMSEYIKGLYYQNYNALHLLYPSASECCQYNHNSKQLWTRNYTHEDFLFFRLGLGNIEFQVNIKVPADKFSMVYDSLRNKPAMLRNNFKMLRDVPVGIDFKFNHLCGIAGGTGREGVYNVVNNLIVQITSSISYVDAKIVFCFDGSNPEEVRRWEYVKWLPHIWSKDKSMRYYATNKQEASDVFFELTNIIRHREEVSGVSYGEKTYSPHYFLFISDITLLDGELIGKYIFDHEGEYGLTTLIMTDSFHNLPNRCECIIQNDNSFSGIFNALRNTDDAISIKFDAVNPEELVQYAKRLADISIKEVEDNTELVSSLTFFEMYGAITTDDFRVPDQWRKNRTYNSMRALIGKKAGGSDCYLDIHEKHHGPHGLVAGTTGSGKSETIQTFILSLAINFSPDDIAFFIIDFKGGGMANLFSGLPHMAGQISNLSGNQIRRAMVSIKSENLRRQKLFSEFGVNNINQYTQLYKNGKAGIPIPHLLIIIDEFAELKKEEPDFMRELISVAQVGRSLGVHLILATQKPAGTVDDNIWSNAKFRICLRVQDRQDSNDMLHNPDAAYITQAGRAYLQVGNNELYEQFQSGWSGAIYDGGGNAGRGEIATMITPTGKTALVGSHTKMKYKDEEKKKWYGFLYENAVRMFFGEDACDDAAVHKLISVAKSNGYHIDDSASDILAIRNFLSIMPKDMMPTEKAVGYISMMALQNHLKLPELKEKTQLEVIVDYLVQTANECGYNYRAQLWMPLLRRNIELMSLMDKNKLFSNGVWQSHLRAEYNAIVGEYDDPQNQTQLPFALSFPEDGHLAVCGSVVSGKSTFLQTMVFSLAIQYSPDEVNFYVLDFSGGMLSVFRDLPHCGGVITEDQVEQTSKLFNMIDRMITERKRMFNGGNFVQYSKANHSSLPAIFIVIDNFAGFKEKTDNAYENVLIRLAREGIAYGIFLAMSSAGFGMSEIQNRIGDHIRTVVSLDMGDKFKYMDVLRTTHIDVLPESGIKGRGIAYVDGRLLEFQTAVAMDAEDDYKRTSAISQICERMARTWTGPFARAIPYIPEAPSLSNLCELEDYRSAIQSQRYLPFAYLEEDASVYSVDLSKVLCYMINGKKRTGKTNTLKLLIAAAKAKKARIAVIESNTEELRSIVQESAAYISGDREIFEYFNELTPQFIERNRFKKTLIAQGLSDEEIFEQMNCFEPVFIFISDLKVFMESVYQPSEGIKNMSGFFENIFEKGYLHNIYFFACFNPDDSASLTGRRAYTLFTSYKTGVHLGGNLSSQRIFNFTNIHFSVMSKQMKRGEGLTPSCEDESVAEKIVIPYFGGSSI